MYQVHPQETEDILRLAREATSVDGDFVEFGCYRGDTSIELAKILRSTPEKRLWLYDSFAGLPEKSPFDASSAGDNFQAGALFATKRELVDRFRRANLPRPIIKKAFFDQLDPAADLPEQIAFAFLDGDLYTSIKTSLHLVWPRMNKRGIIIVHDYNNPSLPGAARAVDEFLRTHPAHLTIRHTLAIITR